MGNSNFQFQSSLLYKKKILKLSEQLAHGRYGYLDHFAVNIIRPNGQTLCLCSNTDYLVHYQTSSMSKYEIALTPWVMANSLFMPWRALLSSDDLPRWNRLVSFKEQECGLYSGISFVTGQEGHYLNVAVASKNIERKALKVFVSRAEEILNLGSFFYENFIDDLENLHQCSLPVFGDINLSDKHLSNVDVFQKLNLDAPLSFSKLNV